MSYCRNNGVDSDVYVINSGKKWECLGCPRAPRVNHQMFNVKGWVSFETRQGILDHLLEHRRLGDKVPNRALERLRREIREE